MDSGHLWTCSFSFGTAVIKNEEFYTQDFTFYFSIFFQMEMSVRDSRGSFNWKIVAILDYYTFERNEGPCD